ncbi:glycoside hydrolase family 57 protein [Thermococcus cleftensis]|uniref:Glycoside hydrolase family 57 protein n=1 Tax=Thermococcus cleftensis (strain DSM 27260 / KACC 17922 / CL1) TaxID=163003 RepID=I3ZTM1_THECF|nr:carbohydrate-binding protein [Thermococcus cleftensis]AFL95055.1 glycoside hydrolase family 57 protein [Thermococcus cleftensis]
MKRPLIIALVLLAIISPALQNPAVAYPSADGSPFDWVYDNVKALDGHDDLWYRYDDGDDLAGNLVAFYYSENPDTITLRIDVTELEIGEEANANWYVLMDFADGGQNWLPDNLVDSNGNGIWSGMAWDLAVAVYDSSNYNVYFPDWSVHNDVVKAVSLNADYDFIEIELYKDRIPNFPSGGQVHFQVVSSKDFSSPYHVTDSMPDDLNYYFTSDDKVGTAKVAFVHHGNQHIGYTDVFCGGVGTGFDEILRTHDAYKVPVNLHLSGVLLESLLWNDPDCGDFNFREEINKGISEGWISILTSAYGQHIMPFFPADLNVRSLGKENELIWRLFAYDPRVAWVPERVWETGLSDSDPVNGVKSDPWEYFAAIDPADGRPYVEAVILDGNTHGSNAGNPYKVYRLPNGQLRVFFIDDWLKDSIYNPDERTNIKRHFLDFALSSDQEQILVYADDWEKAAGVAGWPTDPENYLYFVRYVAAHPWIQAVKLDDVLSWSSWQGGRFWGDGGDYWPIAGTYTEIGGTAGYGGTGDVNGDGSAERNAWYKDWAINYYPYNCPKSAGGLWWDAYQELKALENAGVSNNLVEMAWTTLLANIYETGWHDGLTGPISGWEKEITAHARHALVYAYAAWWLNDSSKPLSAYWKNVDGDNDDEVVIQNDRLYAVIDPVGGRIGWLFDSSGNVVIGNSMALWSGTEGDYNDGNHVWALSDAYDGGTYENDYYQLEILEDGSDGRVVVVARHPSGFYKVINLEEGWPYLEITYRNVGGRTYVKTGFSPGISDMLLSGKANVGRTWLYSGAVAGYYNSVTDTLGAYVIPAPASFNRGEDWRTLAVVDEISFDSDARFYLFAGPWNASLFGKLLSSPLSGSFWTAPAVPSAGESVTVYYNATGGPLEGASSIALHWGHDGWLDASDVQMTYENGLWKAILQTDPGWGSIELAFTDGSHWDDNGGRSYRVYLAPDAPAGISDVLTGDEVGWSSDLPAPNTGEIINGEYAWHDASADVHATENYPLPASNYDLESVRVRADGEYLYISIKLANLTGVGLFGSPVIEVLLNTGTGANTTVPLSGGLSYSPGWDYALVLDLSRPNLPSDRLLGSPAVLLYDSSFGEVSGDYYAVVSTVNDVVQVAVPRALLGDASSIGINVLVLIGDGKGGTVDPGSPKVVDLMSPLDTDGELADGSIDYSQPLDVTAVPFFGSALGLVVLLGFLWLFRRG